jgi:hypothetical protein
VHEEVGALPKGILYSVYLLMILVGLVAMYALLNTGSPDSWLRAIFPDPAADFYVAVISSVVVFILGFFVFFSRDREGFRHLIALNAERIRQMRRKGKRDEEIADAILAAMGSVGGYRHNLARKKLIVYLSDFR